LAVLEDDDFAVETIGMAEDAVDEATHKVRVCGSATFPLAVDFDENDIIAVDDA
jgi:hypothetical protein